MTALGQTFRGVLYSTHPYGGSPYLKELLLSEETWPVGEKKILDNTEVCGTPDVSRYAVDVEPAQWVSPGAAHAPQNCGVQWQAS